MAVDIDACPAINILTEQKAIFHRVFTEAVFQSGLCFVSQKASLLRTDKSASWAARNKRRSRLPLAVTLRSNYGTHCSSVSVTHPLRDEGHIM
jgi:hypothetical protein